MCENVVFNIQCKNCSNDVHKINVILMLSNYFNFNFASLAVLFNKSRCYEC